MRKVYYKGNPYEFKTTGNEIGERHFHLYKDNVMIHSVHEQELDKKSVVSMLLDAYFRNTSQTASVVNA